MGERVGAPIDSDMGFRDVPVALSRLLHQTDVVMVKAFRDEAVVVYREPRITQVVCMGSCGHPA